MNRATSCHSSLSQWVRARGITVLMTEQMARRHCGWRGRRSGTVAEIREIALARQYL